MPDFSLEDLARQQTSRPNALIVGLDEAGCGPWAGPVLAGAVVFPDPPTVPHDLLSLLNDSKTLTEKKRLLAYDALRHHEGTHCWIGIGHCSVAEIDALNIRQAALLAMARACDALPQAPQFALVDGICLPKLPYPAQAFKKGDGRSYSIAAASILAKVTRDRLMTDLANDFPEYGWESNAGYGTKAHQHGLQQKGITPHHRRSFAPIAALLPKVA